jgi:UDP-N-acetyl-D-mannosaminuronate dehydrogenase
MIYMSDKISVIGLDYVDLPLADAFLEKNEV